MSNRVALVCPTGPDKFQRFLGLVQSYKSVSPDCDLFFVLDESERKNVHRYKFYWDRTKYIFAPHLEKNDSENSYKKFLGVNDLFLSGTYEGIATIDCDTRFVGSGFQNSFQRFATTKLLHGYPLESFDGFFCRIVDESTKYFADSEQLTKFRKLYGWWNTLPWYISEHVGEFFVSINYNRNRFVNESWFAFDHMVYESWLASTGKFEVSDQHYFLEYPEKMKKEDLGNIAPVEVDWIRNAARGQACFRDKRPLLHYHLDRQD